MFLEKYCQPDLDFDPEERSRGVDRVLNNCFRDLKLLLDERKNLKERVSSLQEEANNLIDATACSQNTSHTTDLSSLFHSWSALLTQQLERKLHGIQLAIDQVWTKYEKQYDAEYTEE